MTRQGLKALESEIQRRTAPAPALEEAVEAAAKARQGEGSATSSATAAADATATAGPGADGPTPLSLAAAVARDVAQDLAEEYVPLKQQEKIYWASLGALAMLGFVLLVRLVQR